MEAQQQQMNIHDQDGNVGSNKPPSFLCRQSSTRWTPTTDQIRILKELYYNNGIRSPSAEQIQRISARLREYGKIEGKNVFYWFQNHKARERQKKRFTTATANNDQVLIPAAAPSFHRNNINAVNPGHWRSSHDHQDHSNIYNNTYPSPNFTPPAGVIQSSPNTHGVFAAVGQTGSYGYGSLAMEKSFRECSISPKDNHSSSGGSIPCPYPFLDKFNSTDHDHETLVDEDEEEDDDQNMEIETLPLFPMHGEEYRSSSCNNFMGPHDQSSSNGHYYGSWYQSDIGASFGGSARASLELSLNSYITGTRSGDQFY